MDRATSAKAEGCPAWCGLVSWRWLAGLSASVRKDSMLSDSDESTMVSRMGCFEGVDSERK